MTENVLYSFIICFLLCGPVVRTHSLRGEIDNEYSPLGSGVSEGWTAVPWISDDFNFGQISGVSVDPSDNVYLFHRGDRTWDYDTFTNNNVYSKKENGPIKEATILIFTSEGKLLNKLGANMFFLPHGITVDNDFNIYVTDVALHQVMKLSPNSSKILLKLGEDFVPGTDLKHFCKPTSVAVLANGDFFVADGYCNSRIMKFNSEGKLILHWGRRPSGYRPDDYQLQIPHALAVIEDKGLLCTADRENGRIMCYTTKNGNYSAQYSSDYMGSRLFSVAYSPVSGGELFVVNGKSSSSLIHVQGFVLSLNGKILGSFGAGSLKTPHDIATSSNGSIVYVVEIGPNRAWKFVYNAGTTVHQITETPKLFPQESKPALLNNSSDEGEGLTGAILVTISCFVFAFGLLIVVMYYSKSRKSGNADTKRLLSNLDY
ncbi:peptidyl-alpha-hydroxyglycine alpha-amidating lyase 1 isoform X2 [Halyomorpha halys]|uniref:peptidyl-alpha-hydroxyglycine alpha-amidating lyase 1 isoform X2 n=1 Tax=Halyomorpha halys TaxID=286706 RepID=UPI0006D4CDAA